MQATKKKITYPSLAQKARMISLLESDRDLQRRKFSSSFSKREAERRWAAIANDLNSLPGARKAWTEWRKTWQDMKATAKKKHTARRELAGAEAPAAPGEAVTATLTDNAAIERLAEFEGTANELERTLISLVGQQRCLWHPGDAEYANKRLRDALWGDVARQLRAHSGSSLSAELIRHKWKALRDARAASRKLQAEPCKYAELMSFLDDIDELSELHIDASALNEEPIQEDLESMYDTQYGSPAEPEDRKTTAPPSQENPQQKHINRQIILHQRTIKRFNRFGLDPNPSNPQAELDDDSESAAEAVLMEDGHTHFCLSLAPLMRSLPLPRVVGVRIKILQLLRDAMEIE